MVLGVPTYICRTATSNATVPAMVDAIGATDLPTAARDHAARRGVHLDDHVSLTSDRDAYRYSSLHGGSVTPSLRVAYHGHVVYLDAVTVTPVASLDARARAERWLYHGLHSFDCSPLRLRPWLRLPLMMVLLAGGLALCVSGIIGLARRRWRIGPR